VAVLEEGGPLAQLLARLKVVRRCFQVTLFQQNLAQPDVQVTKNGGSGTGILLGRPQGTLVEPSRHPGLATNHPHLREGHRAPELVGDVSRGVQAQHRLRVHLHSGLEVASPHADKPRKPAAPARVRWSSGPASSSACRACAAVPVTSSRACAAEAR